jgi:hypothetical protein
MNPPVNIIFNFLCFSLDYQTFYRLCGLVVLATDLEARVRFQALPKEKK